MSDVTFACVEAVDFRSIDVKPKASKAGPSQCANQRQTNVAQPDNADYCAPRFDEILKARVSCPLVARSGVGAVHE